MNGFWRKRFIWGVFFVILVITIPLIFYFFKSTFLSLLPLNFVNKTKLTGPGTCLILPEQYCSKAKLITQQTPSGKTVKMIGIRVDIDEPLTMPIDGQITKTKLVDHPFFKGYQATIFDPNNPKREYIISGDIIFDDMFSLNMKKGEVFGHIQDTGIEMLGYNLVIYIADIGADGKEITTEEEMNKLFPSTKL